MANSSGWSYAVALCCKRAFTGLSMPLRLGWLVYRLVAATGSVLLSRRLLCSSTFAAAYCTPCTSTGMQWGWRCWCSVPCSTVGAVVVCMHQFVPQHTLCMFRQPGVLCVFILLQGRLACHLRAGKHCVLGQPQPRQGWFMLQFYWSEVCFCPCMLFTRCTLCMEAATCCLERCCAVRRPHCITHGSAVAVVVNSRAGMWA